MQPTIIKLNPNPAGFGSVPDELETQMFDSPLPVQHSHMVYENDDIGLYVGLWDTTTMSEKSGPYPCDEFMVVLDGQAQINNTQRGDFDLISSGQCFVIPKGYPCQWQQRGYLRKYFLIWQHPAMAIPATPTVDSILLDGAAYSDITQQFTSGSYQPQTPGGNLKAHAYHEFIHVTQGQLTIVDADNNSLKLIRGEAVFIEQGTLCACQTSEDLKAHFARVAITKSE